MSDRATWGPSAGGGPADAGSAPLELTAPEMGFRELVWCDYAAATAERGESRRAAQIKFLPRLLFNPSLQFALLVRMAQKGPRALSLPIRWLQVVLFSSEVYWFTGEDAIVLGPGIKFPHPFNIIIGPGVRIGSGVTIYNNTNIGENRHIPVGGESRAAPRLGDRSVIYAYSAIQGRYAVGHDAVVGIHVVLDEDVPPGGASHAPRPATARRVARRGPGPLPNPRRLVSRRRVIRAPRVPRLNRPPTRLWRSTRC